MLYYYHHYYQTLYHTLSDKNAIILKPTHRPVYTWHSFQLNLGQLVSLFNSPSPSILFNNIPPFPSQKGGEGTVVKEEEWRESTFHVSTVP